LRAAADIDSIALVNTPESLPSDLAAAHAMILAERVERVLGEAYAAVAEVNAAVA
jgi:transposase